MGGRQKGLSVSSRGLGRSTAKVGEIGATSVGGRLILLAGVLFSALVSSHAADISVQILPASGRAVSFDEASGTLAAAMAVSGVTFGKVEGNAITALDTHAEWPTLYALPLGEKGRFLLLDRFEKLRLVEPAGSGDFAYIQVEEWAAEGVPVHAAMRDGELYIAAGGAGLQAYDWRDKSQPPSLRARFPFVDFTKEIYLYSADIVCIADNHDNGLQILRMQDIERPVLLAQRTGGFIDTVDGYGDLIAVGSRNEGFGILDLSDPSNPELLRFYPLPNQARMRGEEMRSLDFNGAGDLLVCTGTSGARIAPFGNVRTTADLPELGESILPTGHSPLDGIFLEDGRLAFTTLEKELILLKP